MSHRKTRPNRARPLLWGIALALLTTGVARAEEPPLTREEVTAVARPDAPAEGAVTWKQAIDEVLRRSPLMRAARAGLDAFEAQLNQADWAYFPTFRLEAGLGPVPSLVKKVDHPGSDAADEYEWDEGKWGYFVSGKLTMVQPIYTFGKILSLRRAARAGVRIGNAQVDAAVWELTYRTAQAYYGVLLTRELDAIIGEGEKWLNKATERMERLRREDSDDYDQNEHLRLKSRVAEFYALKAENKVLQTQARQGLRLLMRRSKPVDVAEKALTPLELTLPSADRCVEVALRSEPGLQKARATAVAAKRLHDNKKAELWPDLVIVAEGQLSDSDVIYDPDGQFLSDPYHVKSVGALLALRWNLDVPQRIFKVDKARADARAAAQSAEVTRDLLEVKVRELWTRLDNQRGLIEVYDESRRAARGWLMANWDLYEDGFGDFRDVMDALVQFYSKTVAYLQVVHDHNILVFELSRHMGTDVRTLTPQPSAEAPPASGDDSGGK